ncbi:MAG: 30S ribosomal protein S18 [Myxococcota bacterium]
MGEYQERRGYGDNGYDRDDRGRDDDRGGRGGARGAFRRRKMCRFCGDKEAVIDYRDVGLMKLFVSERGKIVPRRISGTCALHQRSIAQAVKRARSIALVPFTITGA